MEYFINPFTLTALVPIIVEALKRQFNWKNTPIFRIFKRDIYIAQVVSQVVAILLSIIGWRFNLGFLHDTTLIASVCWGILIGLASNGAVDVGYLGAIYQFINLIKNKRWKG